MIEIFKTINVDWLGKRRLFLAFSTLLLLAGLASSVARQVVPGGTEAFNLGVDFRAGTQITAKFQQPTSSEAVRSALSASGLGGATVQEVADLDRKNEVLIKLPQETVTGEGGEDAQAEANREARRRVETALGTIGQVGRLGEGAAVEIIQTEYVGEVAGRAFRNQAITVTFLSLIGILLYIGFRFEWTYGAAAVITVFHDVLVTLGFFSLFQIEIDLTVVAALLTLVGFSVNDTIVTFDRVRENLRLHRRESLYKITNDAINQTFSRTIITSLLVFTSVLALVVFGGEVLRGFSLALFIGVIVGAYSTIAIAAPMMVWMQQRVEGLTRQATPEGTRGSRATAGRATANNLSHENRTAASTR
jgi:preprotein translocase subunit SecF